MAAARYPRTAFGALALGAGVGVARVKIAQPPATIAEAMASAYHRLTLRA